MELDQGPRQRSVVYNNMRRVFPQEKWSGYRGRFDLDCQTSLAAVNYGYSAASLVGPRLQTTPLWSELLVSPSTCYRLGQGRSHACFCYLTQQCAHIAQAHVCPHSQDGVAHVTFNSTGT